MNAAAKVYATRLNEHMRMAQAIRDAKRVCMESDHVNDPQFYTDAHRAFLDAVTELEKRADRLARELANAEVMK